LQEKCTRFLIDSNLFIAAVKGRWTKSSELLSMLLDSPIELVANKALLSEYEKYAKELGAEYIFDYLKSRIILVDQSDEEVGLCKPFFPNNQAADIVHAATCLQRAAPTRRELRFQAFE
jgi:predicted nucleic acid-binding protein